MKIIISITIFIIGIFIGSSLVLATADGQGDEPIEDWQETTDLGEPIESVLDDNIVCPTYCETREVLFCNTPQPGGGCAMELRDSYICE